MTEPGPKAADTPVRTTLETPAQHPAFDNFRPLALTSPEALSFVQATNAGRQKDTAAMVSTQEGKPAILPDTRILLPSARRALAARQGQETKAEPANSPLDILANKEAAPEKKLKAAYELKSKGIDRFSLREADGSTGQYRIETEKMGSGEAVRIWGVDQLGKNHVAMRGIKDSAGIRPEGSKDGDFRGSFWKSHMQGDALTAGASEKAKAGAVVPPKESPKEAHKDAKKETRPDGRDYLKEHSGEPFSKDELSRLNTMFDDMMKGVGKVGKIFRVKEGLAAFKSMMEICIDGSKRASEIDKYGSPDTALGGVDGEKDNYIVLPENSFSRHGAYLNDPALVRANGKIVEAVYAERGRHYKLGEASAPVARALGYSGDPNGGGTHDREVEYLVLSGRGPGRGTPLSREEQRAAIRAQLRDWEAKRR